MALQNEPAVRRRVTVYIAGIQRRGLGWRPDAASGGRPAVPSSGLERQMGLCVVVSAVRVLFAGLVLIGFRVEGFVIRNAFMSSAVVRLKLYFSLSCFALLALAPWAAAQDAVTPLLLEKVTDQIWVAVGETSAPSYD